MEQNKGCFLALSKYIISNYLDFVYFHLLADDVLSKNINRSLMQSLVDARLIKLRFKFAAI